MPANKQYSVLFASTLFKFMLGKNNLYKQFLYSCAAFRIVSVYTGHDLLTNVTKSVAPDNVYNISNFGSKAKCYADVEAGNRYILFLTLFDGQLSAKYDDLFGAASVFTESDDEEINNYLGKYLCKDEEINE